MFIKDSSDGIGKVVTVFYIEKKKLETQKSQTTDPEWRVRRCEIWSPVIFLFHPLFISRTLSAQHKLAEATGEGVSGCK